jgi:hypothetical protein
MTIGAQIPRPEPRSRASRTRERQQRFLDDECFQLTVAAAMQRNEIYAVPVDHPSRVDVRASLRVRLRELDSQYAAFVSDDAHETNIVALAEGLSRAHGAALRGGRFRIGSAQKALDLHLKYRRGRGLVPEPPHCPFDVIVIQAMRPRPAVPTWTQIDPIDDYRTLVAAARAIAALRSLAQWALALYASHRSPRPNVEEITAATTFTLTRAPRPRSPT